MFYLLATILLNVLISVLFKLFPKYGINGLQAIVFNYITCVATGSVFIGSFPIAAQSLSKPWLLWAALSGAMFISVFNLLAYCTARNGITTSTIANKLSLVIPVAFSLLLYKEYASATRLAGLVLALPAVYLVTRAKEEGHQHQNIFWTVLLFAGSGLLDTLVKYTERQFLSDNAEAGVYTIHVFAVAALLGSMLIFILTALGKVKLHWKNVLAGIVLGIPNYFSIYYFICFLHSNVMQSSAAIPVNNIGIVVASALTAILLFREKPDKYRIIGLVLSVLSILLIAYQDLNGRGI